MRIKILAIVSAFVFSACQPNGQQSNSPSNAQPAVSPTVAPTNSVATVTVTPDKTKIKFYDGKGVVTKINLEIVSVELDHEEIKGLMPKMIMEFYVSEKSELEKLKVGDKVDFVLEDNAGAERIVKIKKAKNVFN